jgi:hypothetical protein
MAEHVSPVSRGRKLEIYWKPIAVLVDPKIFASLYHDDAAVDQSLRKASNPYTKR